MKIGLCYPREKFVGMCVSASSLHSIWGEEAYIQTLASLETLSLSCLT